MPRVSTFCPRCGEAIETEVPDEARAAGRAELTCPACRFDFVIAPARSAPGRGAPDAAPPGGAPSGPARATHTTLAPRTAKAASFKPTAAAMMLFFAALVGLYLGSVLTFQDDIIEVSFEDQPGNGNFTGRVHAGGDPLANASVVLFDARIGAVDDASSAFATTTTSGDGTFRFSNIPLGVYTARIEATGHRTVLLESIAYPSEYEPFFGDGAVFGDVDMEPGEASNIKEVSIVDTLTTVTRWIGAGILAGSLLAIAGGVAALRRRMLPLAILGAVGAFLTWGFFLNWLIGVIALVLLILGRKEFQRRVQRA